MAKNDETEIPKAGAAEDAAVAESTPTAAEKKAAAAQSSQTEPRFTRERLLSSEGENIAGYPSYVIAGALAGDDTAEFTRAQIKKKVETFLARPVEQEG